MSRANVVFAFVWGLESNGPRTRAATSATVSVVSSVSPPMSGRLWVGGMVSGRVENEDKNRMSHLLAEPGTRTAHDPGGGAKVPSGGCVEQSAGARAGTPPRSGCIMRLPEESVNQAAERGSGGAAPSAGGASRPQISLCFEPEVPAVSRGGGVAVLVRSEY